jgi:glutamate synthase domain-containing protein 1
VLNGDSFFICYIQSFVSGGIIIMLLKEGQVRIPSGCAISGFINRKGKLISGSEIIKSITVMHDRSNGLGGGFAGYGIYPHYKELYAFHIFYYNQKAKELTEEFINKHFEVESINNIETRLHPNITDEPVIMRYFVNPLQSRLKSSQLDEREYVSKCVIKINNMVDGSYVFSSGKNMGVFKAVGYPEDVGEFYRLDEYQGYSWTAHGRYPTNTPGWWGGAHPFALLDYTIVHNGEISSYDANRRFMEMYGYKCKLATDTEVITYIFDFLNRHNNLPLEEVANIVCAKFWDEIDQMPEDEKKKHEAYRAVYGSLLINGPFSVILGFNGGIMALNDRLKLRSMVAAEKGDMTYFASEESAIRAICGDPTRVWAPRGGEPCIARLEEGVII